MMIDINVFPYNLENKQRIKDRVMQYRQNNPDKFTEIKLIDKHRSKERRLIQKARAILEMVD